MSRIHLRREHPFTIDEAKERLEVLRLRMRDKFGLSAEWAGNDMRFKGRGADGRIRLENNQVEVDIKLGLLLSPLKSKLEDKIVQGLDDIIQKG